MTVTERRWMPASRRLLPNGDEIVEVRWVNPRRGRPDVEMQRFRRRRDALLFAGRLTRDGMAHVGVYVASITAWALLGRDGRIVTRLDTTSSPDSHRETL